MLSNPIYVSTTYASNTLGRNPKEVLIFALENQIPLYVFIGSRNNVFTIGDSTDTTTLKVMEGPLYPVVEEPLNNGGEIPSIITYRNTCKPVLSSGYEELLPKDIKQIINDGVTTLLGFKSDIAGYCRYIQNFIDVNISEVYLSKIQLYRFKEKYLIREDFDTRNSRMLNQAIELYKEDFKYENIIEIITNNENSRLKALNLPPITKGTVTKLIRKNMLMRHLNGVKNV